jgi:hypothetical protein
MGTLSNYCGASVASKKMCRAPKISADKEIRMIVNQKTLTDAQQLINDLEKQREMLSDGNRIYLDTFIPNWEYTLKIPEYMLA